MQFDITVLATEPVRERLTTWLREGNCLPQQDTGGEDEASPRDGTVLITFLTGAKVLDEAVTAEFLGGLHRPLLWLQMSQLTEEDAHFLSRRAAEANVKFVHAPYFGDPETQDRPMCLVYENSSLRGAVTSGPCAATLIDALSCHSEWVGPLGSGIAPRPERDALADHAIDHHRQMAL